MNSGERRVLRAKMNAKNVKTLNAKNAKSPPKKSLKSSKKSPPREEMNHSQLKYYQEYILTATMKNKFAKYASHSDGDCVVDETMDYLPLKPTMKQFDKALSEAVKHCREIYKENGKKFFY